MTDAANVIKTTFFKFVSEILRDWFVIYPEISRISNGATKIVGISQAKILGMFATMVSMALSIY